MVCTCLDIWILPFKVSDFKGCLTNEQYQRELEAAQARAYYIMTAKCDKAKNPGWGISLEDLQKDESGQLQIAFQLLTASEFLSMYPSMYGMTRLSGEYESPTGERVEKSSTDGDLDLWVNQGMFYREKAYEAAYEYIPSCGKQVKVLLISENYDWQTLEKEYHQEIFPQYDPLPYINSRYRGSTFYSWGYCQ